ncbi:MAG TPA: DUF6766 family protein [Gemmatimonadaceae bacterium]|nr:DUF6766 family protein [Gemmatimonadaceae bacterium]
MRVLRNNGLSIALTILFLITLAGQSVAGFKNENEERRKHGEPPQSYGTYLRSPAMLEATAENWESEFFQMGVYVLITVFLFQKGSVESKDPEKKSAKVDREPDPNRPGAPWPVKRGGFILALYKRSLALAFLILFLASFVAHAIGGAGVYNEEQLDHPGSRPVSVLGYMQTSRFWFESLQNWQSEFLAVLSIVVLSIHLRQFGSPESKPVDAPHSETGE